MLGDAGESLGLLPDVADKVLDGLPVHLLVLEDGVGQQADGGQGVFSSWEASETKRRRTSSVV